MRKRRAEQSVTRETASREHEDTDISRNGRLESTSRIQAVPVEYRSTSREIMGVVDPRNLLEAQNEANGRLTVEVLEPRKITRILVREGSDIVGPKTHYLLKRICTNTEPRLFIRPFV